jgi:hypothetical protein
VNVLRPSCSNSMTHCRSGVSLPETRFVEAALSEHEWTATPVGARLHGAEILTPGAAEASVSRHVDVEIEAGADERGVGVGLPTARSPGLRSSRRDPTRSLGSPRTERESSVRSSPTSAFPLRTPRSRRIVTPTPRVRHS